MTIFLSLVKNRPKLGQNNQIIFPFWLQKWIKDGLVFRLKKDKSTAKPVKTVLKWSFLKSNIWISHIIWTFKNMTHFAFGR